MIRILCWIGALLLCGCMSTPAPVDVKGCCYPGAQIALARMPSTGDVAISLGAIEHVLVSRTDTSEREHVTPRPSENPSASISRIPPTPGSLAATHPYNSARRPRGGVDQLPRTASWIDFVGADHLGDATKQDSCPTDVAYGGAQ